MPHHTRPGRSRLILLLGLGTTATLASLVLLCAVVLLLIAGGRQLISPACDPSPAAALTDPAASSAAGRAAIPPQFTPVYRAAAARFLLGPDGWLWLAAIHRVETNFSRDLAVSSAGAKGPMQFMPDTWRRYGIDADHDGHVDITSDADAIFGAANYLHASGAPRDWHAAVFAYNYAEWYYQRVLTTELAYRATPNTADAGGPRLQLAADHSSPNSSDKLGMPTGSQCAPPDALPGADIALTPGGRALLTPSGLAVAPQEAPAQVKAILAAGNQIVGRPYTYGGGHGPPLKTPVASYDCSSSISYILFHAALFPDPSAWVSGAFAADYAQPGPGRWVTVRANADHVYMYVAGLRWDTHRWGPTDAGVPGIGWHTAQRPDTGFTPRHPTSL